MQHNCKELTCPLCKGPINKIEEIDNYVLQSILSGWGMFPILHDLRASFTAITTNIDILGLVLEKNSIDKNERLEYILQNLTKQIQFIGNYIRIMYENRIDLKREPFYRAINEIELIHKNINNFLRFKYIINPEQLNLSNIYIDIQAYSVFVYLILQGVLIEISHRKFTEVPIKYYINQSNLMGEIKLPLNESYDNEVTYHWNFTSFIGLIYGGDINIFTEDNNLVRRWSFPITEKGDKN